MGSRCSMRNVELRGGLADQGTEFCIAGEHYPEDQCMLFLYLFLLMLPGMMHTLHSAVQEAIMSHPEPKHFFD